MIRQRSAIWAIAWVWSFGTASSAIAAPPVALIKSQSLVEVEARVKLAQEINDSLFSFSELAFQEYETAKYLTNILEKEGFVVQRGIAGLPTGWVARWTNGSGGPVIALGSDIDGIPKANQKPGIPWREPIVAGAPGHGEGHNSGQAVNIVAALAVRDLMKRHNIAGTLLLWPGVAEELVAGKAFMVRDGVFKNVDAVLFTHVGNNLETAWGQPLGTGLVSVEYTFKGESAHSAAAPWRGRSALDAVELMNLGWNMRREHLRPEQRSHYVISDGGDQPNVVPSVASVWYFFREQDFKGIQNSFDIGNVISEAAAKMTDTTVTRRIIGTAAPRHFNRPIAEAAFANITAVGLPKWTPDEQAFAKFQAAQGELTSALSRLMVIVENYPQLKSDANFRDLQAQLEGTENRITVARNRYIKAVQEYNVTVRSFPSNLTAMLFGFATKPSFTVENEQELAKPPKVDFNAAPAGGAAR